MYFLPSDDQLELQRGVREVLASAFPIDKLPDGFDQTVWDTLVETGVFAIRTDLGLGLADASLVFEELGRACVPGPFVATFITAGYVDGPVTFLDPARQPLLVPYLEVAGSILVLGDRPTVAPADGGVPQPDPLDPLTPLHELAQLPAGSPIEVVGGADQLRRDGALLTAAIQVGIAARLTELAVAYAKTREQFDRPIGSFQAVKHICADMLVRTELARASLHSAAVILDDVARGDAAVADPGRAVSGAKLLADEAATMNGRSCVQVHGGMGFTWEVPVHFFLKRAWLHATEFGTADEHAEDLADAL
jgi:alkylation response protein AidB-like acyl-CoA dehydrogenase